MSRVSIELWDWINICVPYNSVESVTRIINFFSYFTWFPHLINGWCWFSTIRNNSLWTSIRYLLVDKKILLIIHSYPYDFDISGFYLLNLHLNRLAQSASYFSKRSNDKSSFANCTTTEFREFIKDKLQESVSQVGNDKTQRVIMSRVKMHNA